MTPYRVADHIHLCLVDDSVIMLDLRAGSYRAVGSEESKCLMGQVARWPRCSASTENPRASDLSTASTASDALLAQLLNAGIIAESSDAMPPDDPPIIPSATEALIEGYTPVDASSGIADFLRFLKSCLLARSMLRLCSLERLVARLRWRSQWRDGANTNLDFVRKRVATFLRLRPILFTGKDACLFESLALSEFLFADRIVPYFIIGVSVGPFRAHSWLQDDQFIFNDSPEHAGKFKPILVL